MYSGGYFSAEFTEKASNKMRSIVSRQKKRFTYGNYDLDLSCILLQGVGGAAQGGVRKRHWWAGPGTVVKCVTLCFSVGCSEALTVQMSLTAL